MSIRLTGASEALRLARAHVADKPENESSARLCLADAVALADAGEDLSATIRAVASLSYSVGLFHADYKRAAAIRETLAIMANHDDEYRSGLDSVDDGE
jgi:hypothetical protein